MSAMWSVVVASDWFNWSEQVVSCVVGAPPMHYSEDTGKMTTHTHTLSECTVCVFCDGAR